MYQHHNLPFSPILKPRMATHKLYSRAHPIYDQPHIIFSLAVGANIPNNILILTFVLGVNISTIKLF